MPQPQPQPDNLKKLDQISALLIELEGGECNSSFFLRQAKHREIHDLVLDLKTSLAPVPAGT